MALLGFTSAAVFIVTLTQVASEKVIKFYNLECEHNDSYISNLTCDLKVRGRDIIQSNGFAVLTKHIKNARVHGELFKFEDRFKPFLMNITFNICDFFKSNGVPNLILSAAINIFQQKSNLVKCGHEVQYRVRIQVFYIKK